MKQSEEKIVKEKKPREEKYDTKTGLPRALKERLGVNEEDFEKDTSRGKFADLAQAVGVSVAAISQYVHGFTAPSFDVLVKMAKKLNCTTDYLAGLSDVPAASINEEAIVKYTGLDPESVKALHYMNTVPYKAPAFECASKTQSFINRALRIYLEDLDHLPHVSLRDNYLHFVPTVFSFLEDWVTGSGDPGEIKLQNGYIRKDEAFRMIAEKDAKEMLRKYAEYDETFAKTEAEYERRRAEEYERLEKEDAGEED